MCGIAGVAGGGYSEVDRRAMLEDMVAAIGHRGPDDSGYSVTEDMGLGMCRLSIMDVEGGAQPIYNEDGAVAVICNGEIYNQSELRAQLLQKGHVFKSNSDAEVIVHLYEEKGTDLVHDLRGMFAFAVWDDRQRSLFVARDRVGIKPLFFAESNGELIFGSEIKALLSSGKLSRELDWAALGQYFSYGYVPSPRTIFRGIRKLEPGCFLVWRDGRTRTEAYWKLEYRPERARSEEYYRQTFLELFQEAVKLHLMSDVPLGAFLSGGVDSSLVVAVMSEASTSPTNTFTMGFGGNKGGYLDERVYAREISQKFATNHEEYEVLPALHDIMDDIVESFDEPFADDSVIPSYYICQLARQKVKVALTGLGGDELFGGYERYLGIELSAYYGRVPGFLRRSVINPLVNRLPERGDGHYTINHMKRFVRAASLQPAQRYRQYLTTFDEQATRALFSSEAVQELDGHRAADPMVEYFDSWNSKSLLDRATYLDIRTYLPEDILALSDRLSMRHSLELRVPFVDHKVVEFCATIPSGMKIKMFRKKYLLKKAASQYLPKSVLDHRKQGFASPMAAWLRTDLKEYVMDALSEEALRKHGLFKHENVRRMIEDHQNRVELNDKKIFAILMFQKWFERYQNNHA